MSANGGVRSAVGWVRNLLTRRSTRYSAAAILGVGFFAGIVFWGGFNTGLEATNRLEFCISCHEMKDNVYQEYKTTIHYTNRTGVRAICSDCHVPHDWTLKMLRKMKASFEVWGHLTGYIDTREKFESHRLELAQHEWARMKAADSRECRNCHSWDGMNADAQRQAARTSHASAQAEGQTCIDCHQGIAHHKPVDPNAKQPDFDDIK